MCKFEGTIARSRSNMKHTLYFRYVTHSREAVARQPMEMIISEPTLCANPNVIEVFFFIETELKHINYDLIFNGVKMKRKLSRFILS